MLALWLSNAPAAVIAAAIGMTTPCDEAEVAPQATGRERIDVDQGLPGFSLGDLRPNPMAREHAAVFHGPVFEHRARPRMVHDHDDSDMPAVAFVPAPDSGQLILVRHADRDPGETVLNATGKARALALPAALTDLPLDAIFIADFRRNADTAAPLAEARGLAPEVRDPDSALAAALAHAAEGGSVIWIGNVGNLSHLWDAYRLPGAPPVEYGEIAVLTAEGGTWRVARRAFAP